MHTMIQSFVSAYGLTVMQLFMQIGVIKWQDQLREEELVVVSLT